MDTSRKLMLAGCIAAALALAACAQDDSDDYAAAEPPLEQTEADRADLEMTQAQAYPDATTDTTMPTDSMADTGAPIASTAMPTHETSGTVTAVDVESKIVTLDPEPVVALELPETAVAFTVEDPLLLEEIEVGEEIDFSFVEDGEGYLIVAVDD